MYRKIMFNLWVESQIGKGRKSADLVHHTLNMIALVIKGSWGSDINCPGAS